VEQWPLAHITEIFAEYELRAEEEAARERQQQRARG
jgi:hypothetical protein